MFSSVLIVFRSVLNVFWKITRCTAHTSRKVWVDGGCAVGVMVGVVGLCGVCRARAVLLACELCGVCMMYALCVVPSGEWCV